MSHNYITINQEILKKLNSFADKFCLGYEIKSHTIYKKLYLNFTLNGQKTGLQELELYPSKQINIFIKDLNLTTEQKIELFLNFQCIFDSYHGNDVLTIIENDFSSSQKLKPIFSKVSEVDHIRLSKLIKNITHLKLFQPIFNRFKTKDLYIFAQEVEKFKPTIFKHPDISKIFSFYHDLKTSFSIAVHLSKKEISQLNNGREIYDFENILNIYFAELKKSNLIKDHISIENFDRKTKYIFVSETFDFQNRKPEFLNIIKNLLDNLNEINKNVSYQDLCNLYAKSQIIKSFGNESNEENPRKIRKI